MDKFCRWLIELFLKVFFKGPHIFQIICGKQQIIYVKISFTKLLYFRNIILIKIK